MKLKSLIAFGVFAALLAAVFLTREPHVSRGVKSLELPPMPADQVQALEVSGTHHAKLERGPNGWTVAAPDAPDAKYPADEGLVKGLLTALESFKAPDLVTERKETHAQYELDDKGATVKVALAGGNTVELRLGKASSRGGMYVRRLPGDAVFLSPTNLSWQVRCDVTAWRDKRLPTVDAAQLARVVVTHPDGHTFALRAAENEAWALDGEAPQDFRFDAALAGQLVTQLTTLRAQDFPKGEAPTLAAGVTFRLEKKDGTALTVTLGDKRADGSFPLAIEGRSELATVAAPTATALTRRLDDLRDHSLFGFEPAKARRLAIDAGGQRTVVEKRGETWTLVVPKQAPAGVTFDAAQVPSVLARLASLKASRPALATSVAVAGFAKPSAEVTVELEGAPAHRLVLGADAGNGDVYARGVDGLTWVLAGFDKSWLARGVGVFSPPPPPQGLGANGLDQLPPDIRRQLEAQLRQMQH